MYARRYGEFPYLYVVGRAEMYYLINMEFYNYLVF